MNTGVAERFKKGGKTEKMFNFVYSPDLALFFHRLKTELLANYVVQVGATLCHTQATPLYKINSCQSLG